VFWKLLLGVLAGLSAVLGLWQWVAARRFPLHRRFPVRDHAPGVTVLKPLKGSDAFTEKCLRSWLEQNYPGPVQILFGVASASDPVCQIARRLLEQFPHADARLVVCSENLGINAKVSTLIQLQRQARHEVMAVSDADVLAPADLLATAVQAFADERMGVVSCFYRMAYTPTAAMRWEAVAVNADFWSQVLQSNTLKPMDFALGAVMLARRGVIEGIGGFESLADVLADDYQLGHRIVRHGYRAGLCPVVVECWDPPQGWGAVWKHQLRWARTIRVCQPTPYFFSILSNATLWPLLWALGGRSLWIGCAAGALVLLRIVLALLLQNRLAPQGFWCNCAGYVPLKDLLGAALWVGALSGNTIEWRGRRLRLLRDGRLRPIG
jgi:ceramide glucosyltransferase